MKGAATPCRSNLRAQQVAFAGRRAMRASGLAISVAIWSTRTEGGLSSRGRPARISAVNRSPRLMCRVAAASVFATVPPSAAGSA
eukprot:4498996-Pyramimonas_sp.AAC.1